MAPRERIPEKAGKWRGKKGNEEEQEKNDSWLSEAHTAAWCPGSARKLLQLWTFEYFTTVTTYFPLVNAKIAVNNIFLRLNIMYIISHYFLIPPPSFISTPFSEDDLFCTPYLGKGM